ncbi:MAG: hypothetical protein RLZZ01_2463, partial [Actinomycetota bacterium]
MTRQVTSQARLGPSQTTAAVDHDPLTGDVPGA